MLGDAENCVYLHTENTIHYSMGIYRILAGVALAALLSGCRAADRTVQDSRKHPKNCTKV